MVIVEGVPQGIQLGTLLLAAYVIKHATLTPITSVRLNNNYTLSTRRSKNLQQWKICFLTAATHAALNNSTSIHFAFISVSGNLRPRPPLETHYGAVCEQTRMQLGAPRGARRPEIQNDGKLEAEGVLSGGNLALSGLRCSAPALCLDLWVRRWDVGREDELLFVEQSALQISCSCLSKTCEKR